MASGRNTIEQRIALTGADSIKEALNDLGKAGEQAFAAIKAAADKVGAGAAFDKLGASADAVKAKLTALGTAAQPLEARWTAVSGAFGKLDKSFSTVITRTSLLTAGITAAYGAFALLAKSSADAADQAGKTAQKVGLTVEAYSRLKFAADAQNVSEDQLVAGLTILNKTLGGSATAVQKFGGLASAAGVQVLTGADSVETLDAAAAALGVQVIRIGENTDKAKATTLTAAAAFKQLGIATKDAGGNLRPTADIVGDVAEAFSKLPDGAQKSALAVALFGKAGAQLIPLLDEGRQGLDKLFAQSDRLLQTVTRTEAAEGDAMASALGNLGRALLGLKEKVSLAFAPAFTVGAEAFTKLIADNSKAIIAFTTELAREAIPAIKDFFNTLAGNDAAVVDKAFIRVRDDIKGFVGDLRVVVAGLATVFGAVKAVADDIAGGINAVFGTRLNGTILLVSAALLQFVGAFRLLGAAFRLAWTSGSLLVTLFLNLGRIIGPLAEVIGSLGPVLLDTFGAAGALIAGVTGAIGDAVAAAAAFVAGIVGWPVLLVAALAAAAAAIVLFWPQISAAAQVAWNAIVAGAAALAGLIGRAFGALGSGLGSIWNGVVAAAGAAWSAIADAAGAAWNGIVAGARGLAGTVADALGDLGAGLGAVWNAIVSAAQAAWSAIVAGAANVGAGVANAFAGLAAALAPQWAEVVSGATSALNGLVGVAQTVWSGVTGVFQSAILNIVAIVGGFGQQLAAAFTGATNQIAGAAQAITAAIGKATDFAGAGDNAAALAAALVAPFTAASQQIDAIWAGIAATAQKGFDGLSTAAGTAVAQIQIVGAEIANALGDALAGIEATLQAAVGQITATVNDAISRLQSAAASARSAASGASGDSGGGFAGGGPVRGPGSGTSDSIAAWLSNGEFVMRAAAVRAYGVPFMRAINGISLSARQLRSALPHFAMGGLAAPMRSLDVGAIGPALADLLAGSVAAPAPLLAGAGTLASGAAKTPIHLTLPGVGEVQMLADDEVAAKLMRFGNRKSMAAAGRKPSWYR